MSAGQRRDSTTVMAEGATSALGRRALPLPLVRVYRLILVAIIVAGITSQVATSGSIVETFVYFTNQSNAILAAVMLAAALRPDWAKGRFGTAIRGGAVLWICITGLVFEVLLSGGSSFSMMPDGAEGAVGGSFSNTALHVISPIMAVIDWLAWGDSQRRLQWRWTVFWLVYPLAYLVFALVRGLFTGTYPYPFIDVATLGYAGIVPNCIGLLVAFAALGLLVIGLGRLFAELRARI